ncbi:MAG: hypothetical protein ACRD0K_24830 [Egibacteraceae bacterium]
MEAAPRPSVEPPPPDGTFGAYLDVLSSGEAGLFRFGWTTEYPTMDAFGLVNLAEIRLQPAQ